MFKVARGSCAGTNTVQESGEWSQAMTNATCGGAHKWCEENGCAGQAPGAIDYLMVDWSYYSTFVTAVDGEANLWTSYDWFNATDIGNDCYSVTVPCTFNTAQNVFVFFESQSFCRDKRKNVQWDPDCYPDGMSCTGDEWCVCAMFAPWFVNKDDLQMLMAKATGDPHVMRLNGEKFDLLEAGVYDMLRFPPQAADHLLMTARVDRITKDEDGFYMTSIDFMGVLLRGHTVEVTSRPFGIRVTGDKDTFRGGDASDGEASDGLEVRKFHAFKTFTPEQVYMIDHDVAVSTSLCHQGDTHCWGTPSEGEEVKQINISIDGFNFVIKYLKVRALDIKVEVTNGETNIAGKLGYDLSSDAISPALQKVVAELL